MKKIIIAVLSLLTTGILSAQNSTEVLRYSETFPMGNARFTSMGGAFGALGGNASGVSVNPAGSAVFKKDIIEFTPAFLHNKTQNYYQGKYSASFESGVAVPNFGVFFSNDVPDNDLLVSGISYGFSVNRQSDFSESSNYSIVNNTSSLTDEFLRIANSGVNFYDNAYTGLAWNTYLMDYDSVAGMFESDFRNYDGGQEYTTYGQQQDIYSSKAGYMKEYLFNLGVDFQERVFIGASINVLRFNYEESFSVKEKDINNLTYLEEFKYLSNIDANGNGAGGKLGVIIKANDFLRLGFAAHTPTVLNINEIYSSKIIAAYDDVIDGENSVLQNTFDGEFDYKLRKPGKAVASIGFVYKNIAIFDVDFESVNYGYSQLSSRTESFSDENNEIRQVFKKSNNIKAGGELRYGPFSFRGGLALYGDPYENSGLASAFYKQDVTGGIGISNDNFYADLAWVKSKRNANTTFYNDFDGNDVSAKTDSYTDNFFLTFGLKF